MLTFNSPTPLSTGNVRLGGLVAYVPLATPYRSKQLLQMGSTVNGGALPTINDHSLQVVAYLGNGTGAGAYTSNDSGKMRGAAGGGNYHFDSARLSIAGELARQLGRAMC